MWEFVMSYFGSILAAITCGVVGWLFRSVIFNYLAMKLWTWRGSLLGYWFVTSDDKYCCMVHLPENESGMAVKADWDHRTVAEWEYRIPNTFNTDIKKIGLGNDVINTIHAGNKSPFVTLESIKKTNDFNPTGITLEVEGVGVKFYVKLLELNKNKKEFLHIVNKWNKNNLA